MPEPASDAHAPLEAVPLVSSLSADTECVADLLPRRPLADGGADVEPDEVFGLLDYGGELGGDGEVVGRLGEHRAEIGDDAVESAPAVEGVRRAHVSTMDDRSQRVNLG